MTTKKFPRLVVAILLAFAAASVVHAQGSLQESIDRLVQPYLDNKIVMGMTIGVLSQGRTMMTGYGQISAEDGRAPSGDTIYEIGSVSKVFTGILVVCGIVQ